MLALPLRAAGKLVCAIDGLHTLAERARRDPDPVDEARERLDKLGAQLDPLLSVARSLDGNAASIETAAAALLEVTRELHETSCTIVTGAEDLCRTGEVLDAHTQEIISGGKDLTAVGRNWPRPCGSCSPPCRRCSPSSTRSRSSRTRLVEPLQGLTQGVGRVSQRLSRSP